MTAEKPSNILPKLRFPEFRNAAEWKTKILGDQGHFLSSLTGKSAKDFDTGDAAFVPYMNVFSNVFTNTADLRSVNVADGESQNAVAKGDVFFTVSSETPEEAGMSSVLLEEISKCYLNSFCALFRFDEGKSPDPVYLGYLLRAAPAREHLSRGAQGATRYNISRPTFCKLPILIPSGPEQRKIADCLVSLDDLIVAEGRKLETLQQHKQGLIQQLFPQPGETVPRLRFPEFRNAQGWSLKPLGEVLTPIVREREKPTVPYTGLGIRSHGRGTFRKEFENPEKISMTRLYEVNCNDLIVNITFAWEGAIAIAQPEDTGALVSHRFPTYQFVHNAVLPEFFQNPILDKQFIYKLSVISPGGAGRNRVLNKHDFLKIELAFPRISEQRKIADCLGSLDDLIAAESQKLETLQQHKQGLMQQLFPSLEAN